MCGLLVIKEDQEVGVKRDHGSIQVRDVDRPRTVYTQTTFCTYKRRFIQVVILL